jgi:hypothetical protein
MVSLSLKLTGSEAPFKSLYITNKKTMKLTTVTIEPIELIPFQPAKASG